MESDIKICYDHLCFWEKYGGVSKYFVEIIKRLPPHQFKLLLRYSNNEYIKEIPNIKIHHLLNSYNFKGKARLISEVGKLFSIPNLIKGDFNIYHPTHYDCYGLRHIPKRVRTVATIHDMNYFTIPEYYPPHPINKNNQIIMARSVDHIITVSKKSKEDLQEYLNIPESKISVIYHGIDQEAFQNAPLIKYEQPYLLFVGRRNQYKNFNILLHAIATLSEQGFECNLVCAGLPATNSEWQKISDLKINGKVSFIQASDIELVNLYKQAIAFVFPSFYEGFGLPILEAMAAGCPTLISDASCFPEIAQDASLYFNPAEVDSLIEGIKKIIEDDNLRSSLVTKGAKRVRDFSWERSVRNHLRTYKSIL